MAEKDQFTAEQMDKYYRSGAEFCYAGDKAKVIDTCHFFCPDSDINHTRFDLIIEKFKALNVKKSITLPHKDYIRRQTQGS